MDGFPSLFAIAPARPDGNAALEQKTFLTAASQKKHGAKE